METRKRFMPSMLLALLAVLGTFWLGGMNSMAAEEDDELEPCVSIGMADEELAKLPEDSEIWELIPADIPSETAIAGSCLQVDVSGTDSYSKAYELLAKINQKRAEAGVNPLVMDATMLPQAMTHAEENMVAFGAMYRPNGDRLTTAFPMFKKNADTYTRGTNADTALEYILSDANAAQTVLSSSYRSAGVGCFVVKLKNGSDFAMWTVALYGVATSSPATQPADAEVTRTIDVTSDKINFKFNEDSVTLGVGDTHKIPLRYTQNIQTQYLLNAAAEPTCFEWTSNNDVVSVNANGVVTANKVGTAVLTGKNKGMPSSTITYTVNVANGTQQNVKISSITFSDGTLMLPPNTTRTLTAIIAPSNATNQTLTWTSSNSAAVKVDQTGKITTIANGVATITAEATDGSGAKASCMIGVSSSATGYQATSVSLNTTVMTLAPGNSSTLEAKVLPAAASQTVNWSSSNTAVATVDSNGKVTAVSNGTAVITAKAADGSGKQATCTVTVNVNVTGITLNKTFLTLPANTSETLVATVAPAGAAGTKLNWSSSDGTVASVDANGKVTGLKVGTAYIQAVAPNYVTAGCTVSVTEAAPVLVTGVTLNKNYFTLNVSASETLIATVAPSNATNRGLTWKSSNPSIATVDANGKVTAVAGGSATITATAQDGSGKAASCTVTVNQPVQKVTEVTLNKNSLTLNVSASETLIATVAPSNATNKALTWKSSNTSVATIDSNGKVTAVAAGSATITTTAQDGSGKSATCTVTVKQPVTGITFDKTTVTLNVSGSETLQATVAPGNATNKNITWSSSNTSVATVNNGQIKAVAAGTATITATAQDGSGKKATCTVTVKQPVTGISLNKSAVTLNVSGSETLQVTVTPDNATNNAVAWSSSNTSVATVSNGQIKAVAVGSATITATAQDGSGKKATCTVTVKQPVTGITLNKSGLEVNVGKTSALQATVAPANASNKALTWSSNNTSVATVDANGNVKGIKAGSAVITVTAQDGSGKTASCAVTVKQPATGISLNKTSLELTVNYTYGLGATLAPSDASNKAVTWKSSNTSVATVDANGIVTAVKEGTATITATTQDGTNLSASCTVTVKKAAATIQPVTKITLNMTQKALKTGESCNLTATVAPSNATNKAVTWKSSNASVATVDTNGKVTALKAGTAAITVTSSDGTNISASCNITVSQPVTSIVLNNTTLALDVNASATLQTTVYPSDASNKNVTWKSSNTSVATVSNGKVTAVAAGTATITATAQDGSGKQATCTVTVNQPVHMVTAVTLNKTTLALKVPASETLTATIAPANATNKKVTWFSSDSSVATVDANGKITAVKEGTATITATTQDGSGKKASCTVTVTEENPFADVPKSHWGYSYAKYAYANGIMSGKGTVNGKVKLTPDMPITRAEFVQILYNAEGKPAVTYSNKFTDVKSGEWYTNAVIWAANNNIVAGKGEIFDVGSTITREEIAVILYKYATNYKRWNTTQTTNLNSFNDSNQISDWAQPAMKWAVAKNVMKGAGSNLNPKTGATRIEAATMYINLQNSYK